MRRVLVPAAPRVVASHRLDLVTSRAVGTNSKQILKRTLAIGEPIATRHERSVENANDQNKAFRGDRSVVVSDRKPCARAGGTERPWLHERGYRVPGVFRAIYWYGWKLGGVARAGRSLSATSGRYS